jgi:hypothetical protein
MSTFDDPNREAVGMAPIWTGAGDTVEPTVQAEPPPAPAAKSKKSAPEES